MKHLLRYIIGIIFIVSGVVKAIDSVGFSFKLEEYFSPTVFNMPFLESFALPIAVFVSALEVVLGLMLLLNIHLRKTLLALIALCVFFAFLTFYSAYYNVVTDCGCFGDAVKFTPWQSFWKDIILLIGLLILLWLDKKETAEVSKARWIMLWGLCGILAVVIGIGIVKEPIIDFRDYKIGTDLKAEKKKLEDQPSEYKTFYVLKNKTTQEEKKMSQDEYVAEPKYWEEETPWEIQKDKTTSEIVKEGYQSEIAKFRIENVEGADLTTDIINAPKAVLVFSYKPQDLSAEEIAKAEARALAKAQNAMIVGISTQANTFKNIKNATMDGTAIKTIARSNPFILVLENGVVVEKF